MTIINIEEIQNKNMPKFNAIKESQDIYVPGIVATLDLVVVKMEINAEPDQIPQFTDHSTKSYFNISDMVNTRGEILDPNVVSSTTGGTISSDKEKIFEGTDTSSSTNRKNNNNGRVGILESSMISKLTHEPTSGPKSILEIDSVFRQRNSSDSTDKINYSKNSGSSSDATSETPSFHG